MPRPTTVERERARTWLGRHGVQVSEATPLLAIRIGVSERIDTWQRQIGNSLAILFCMGCYAAFSLLHGAERGISPVVPVVVAYGVVTLAGGAQLWYGYRSVTARLPGPLSRLDFASARAFLPGSHAAGFVVALVGGIALLLVMPDRHYVPTLLGALVFVLLSRALVALTVLRASVFAEDDASRAVDDILRARDLQRYGSGFFALVFSTWIVFEEKPTAIFAVLTIAYALLVGALQVIGTAVRTRKHRVLPPGYYGVAAMTGAQG